MSAGKRTGFNRTRVAEHLDEIQGIVANMALIHFILINSSFILAAQRPAPLA